MERHIFNIKRFITNLVKWWDGLHVIQQGVYLIIILILVMLFVYFQLTKDE